MAKIKTAKNGRKYIILPSGKSRFIKSSYTLKVKRGKIKMAKRKSYKRSLFKVKRGRSRSSSKSYGMVGTILAAGVYGAFREKLSSALQPITNKVPLGNISDEVTIGILAIIGKKMIKNPMATKVFDSALIIESARIGEAVISGNVGGMATSGTTSSAYLYG